MNIQGVVTIPGVVISGSDVSIMRLPELQQETAFEKKKTLYMTKFREKVNTTLSQYSGQRIILNLTNMISAEMPVVLQAIIDHNITIDNFNCRNSPNLTSLTHNVPASKEQELLDTFENCLFFTLYNTKVSKLPPLPRCLNLNCINNQITTLDNCMLNNCNTIACGSNKLKIIRNLPFCLSLYAPDNELVMMPYNLPKCTTMFLANNNIQSVDKINDVIKILDIRNNPKDQSYVLKCDLIKQRNPTILDLRCEGTEGSTTFESIPMISKRKSPVKQDPYAEIITQNQPEEFSVIEMINDPEIDMNDKETLKVLCQILITKLATKQLTVRKLVKNVSREKLLKLFDFLLRYRTFVQKDIELSLQAFEQGFTMIRELNQQLMEEMENEEMEKMELIVPLAQKEMQSEKFKSLMSSLGGQPSFESKTVMTPSEAKTYFEKVRPIATKREEQEGVMKFRKMLSQLVNHTDLVKYLRKNGDLKRFKTEFKVEFDPTKYDHMMNMASLIYEEYLQGARKREYDDDEVSVNIIFNRLKQKNNYQGVLNRIPQPLIEQFESEYERNFDPSSDIDIQLMAGLMYELHKQQVLTKRPREEDEDERPSKRPRRN